MASSTTLHVSCAAHPTGQQKSLSGRRINQMRTPIAEMIRSRGAAMRKPIHRQGEQVVLSLSPGGSAAMADVDDGFFSTRCAGGASASTPLPSGAPVVGAPSCGAAIGGGSVYGVGFTILTGDGS